MTELLPDGGLRLNQDAAHPPFAWRVSLPESWALLDTHPATWERSLDRLVDERLAGRRLTAGQRRELRSHLEDVVTAAQRGGVLLSLIQLGPLSTGGFASVGLHLAWYDSAPRTADLSLAREAVGRQGVVEEVETDAGTLLLQRDYLMMTPPGLGSRKALTSLQAFLPLAGRTWTAVVATSSAHPELTDLLRELVIATAGSIAPAEDQPDEGAGRPDPAGTPAAARYEPVGKPEQPGIERGFGTMVVRRFGRSAES
jgi:hypothetical protein